MLVSIIVSLSLGAPPPAALTTLGTPGPQGQAAVKELTELRAQIITSATDLLKRSLQAPELTSESPVIAATAVLVEYRATEAVGLLLDNIEARLAPSAGTELPVGHQFPCAQALIGIGGQAVVTGTIARLESEYKAPRKRLLTWVLYGTVGMELGLRMLERAAVAARGDAVKRLKAAAEGITLGEKILEPFDTTKQPAGAEPDLSKAGCRLPQKVIFTVVKQDAIYWKHCIQQVIDKSPRNLPKELKLSFTVTSKGALEEFSVGNKELARSQLKTCLARFFTTMRFPPSAGANCRIDDWKIPLKAQ